MFNERKGMAAVAAAALAVVLAACGSSSNGGASSDGSPATSKEPTGQLAGPGQSIVVASPGEPFTLNPLKTAAWEINNVLWEVYEALLYFDHGEVKPLLAAEMPKQVAPTVWEFKLRPDVVFSDGTPLDSDDVVYSFKTLLSAETATIIPEAPTFAGAKAVDEHTVQVMTKAPDPLLPSKITSIAIVPEGKGDDWNKVVGSGPYQVTAYHRGQDAVLEYNPRFWGDKPQVTKVTVRFLADKSTRMQALRAGEVDFVAGLSPPQMKQAPRVQLAPEPNISWFLRLNMLNDRPLSDLRLRQALNYAVDWQAIVDGLYPKGMAELNACQLLTSTTGDADPDLKPSGYDPEKAKQLVTEAGGAGQTITMVASSGVHANDREVAQAVVQYIQATGLKVKLKLTDQAGLNETHAAKGDGPDIDMAPITDSIKTVNRAADALYATKGVSAHNLPKLDALYLKAAALAVGSQERQAAWNAVHQYACDEAVMLFAMAWREVYGVSKNIKLDIIGTTSARMHWTGVEVYKG